MKTFFSNNFDVQIQLSSSFYWISLQLLMNLLQCADNSTAEWGRSFMFLSHLSLFSPQKRSFNVREISLLLWDYDGYHKLNLLVKVFRRKEEGRTWADLNCYRDECLIMKVNRWGKSEQHELCWEHLQWLEYEKFTYTFLVIVSRARRAGKAVKKLNVIVWNCM